MDSQILQRRERRRKKRKKRKRRREMCEEGECEEDGPHMKSHTEEESQRARLNGAKLLIPKA